MPPDNAGEPHLRAAFSPLPPACSALFCSASPRPATPQPAGAMGTIDVADRGGARPGQARPSQAKPSQAEEEHKSDRDKAWVKRQTTAGNRGPQATTIQDPGEPGRTRASFAGVSSSDRGSKIEPFGQAFPVAWPTETQTTQHPPWHLRQT